jgi:hypothetical protein
MNHRSDDLPNDSTLEPALETIVAVDPSPEFLARVRTRIAGEEMGHRWRLFPRAWSFEPLFAVGILGVVLLIVVPSWLRPEPPAVVEQPTGSASPVPQQPEPLRVEPDTTKEAEAPDGDVRGGRLQAARRPAQPDAPPFTEVLFSDDERLALLKLVAAVEEGRVPPFPAASAVDEEVLPEGTAMMIEPLVIDPLPQIARLEE